MKRLLIIITAMLLAIAGEAVAQKSITVDGTVRSYLEYVPQNLGSKRPLLISCHGMNQDAAYQKGMLAIESVADTAKFVTVFPNGIGNAWDISGDRDLNLIKALIDKMAEDYDIDRNRVYLSGFSMGGMLTYHAMTRIADRIAAFAPISGYPMFGMTATSSRPVPIIHTHGTGDDVCTFDRVQGILDGWIARNNCSATPKVTTGYRGCGHATKRVWSGGTNGVQVVLLELSGKGHWISNDGLMTGDEIWRFCKNYSLEQRGPQVSFAYPEEGARTPDAFTAAIDVTDEDGDVASVSFFIDGRLYGSVAASPYVFGFNSLKEGAHTLSVLVADDSGYKAIAKVHFTVDKSLTAVEGVTAGDTGRSRVHDISGRPAHGVRAGSIYISNGNKYFKER